MDRSLAHNTEISFGLEIDHFTIYTRLFVLVIPVANCVLPPHIQMVICQHWGYQDVQKCWGKT